VRQGLSADPEAALLHRLEVPAVGDECPLYPPSPPDPSTATPSCRGPLAWVIASAVETATGFG